MDIPDLLHCIRLVGIDSKTRTSSVEGKLSTPRILRRLFSHEEFSKAYPPCSPYLVSTSTGARFSEISWSPTFQEQITREAHWGQTLNVLAELGIPRSTTIRTAQQSAVLQAVIDDAVSNFTYDHELYWITSALAMYLAPQREWTNKYGHSFNFSAVADRLMAEKPGASLVCGGTHTLYTLAVLLQVHDTHGILATPGVPDRVERYLLSASQELADFQTSDGSWSMVWTSDRHREETRHRTLFAPSMGDLIWITGHHLEWQAIVPERLGLPDDRLARAALFILRHTRTRDEVVQDPCKYSHGIHAIQLVAALDATDGTKDVVAAGTR